MALRFASVQAHEHALKSTLLASRMGAVVCCLGTARRSLALLLNRLVKPLDVPITDPQPLVSTRLLARTDIAASVATAVVRGSARAAAHAWQVSVQLTRRPGCHLPSPLLVRCCDPASGCLLDTCSNSWCGVDRKASCSL